MFNRMRTGSSSWGWLITYCLIFLAFGTAQAQQPIAQADTGRAVPRPLDSSHVIYERPVPHGLKPAFSNVQTGDGFTAGVGFGPKVRHPRQFVDVKALLSTRLYWGGVVTLGYAPATSLITYGFGRYRHMPEEDFYGLGKATEQVDRTSYRINEVSGGALAGWTVARRALVGGYGYYLESWYGPGLDDDFPTAQESFGARAVPALGQDTRYAVTGIFAELDRRDRITTSKPPERFLPTDRVRGLSFNSRRGVYLMLRAEQYLPLDGQEYGFSLLEARTQQYLPVIGDVHSLAFGQHAIFTYTAGSHEVPFYLMPAIGGSKSLRGFDGFRFRDRNMVVLNAEYRWQIIEPLDLALFVDAGEVFRTLEEFSLRDLETSYGVGARLRTHIEVPLVPYDVSYLKLRVARSREEVRFGVGLSAFM